MDITGVLVLILVILLLYVLIKYVMAGSQVKTGVESALTQQTIKADSLSTSAVGASNFTHIIWFTVQDWNYNYGTFKPLMVRAPATAGASELVPGLNAKSVCPAVILGSQNNNLEVWQTIQDDGNPITPGSSTHVIDNIRYHKCTVTNIPIQKWCCFIVSFYGRTCDIYLDGKLIKTCVMDGIAKVDKDLDMFITPGIEQGKGSFQGYTSNYQFIPRSINPQEAYEIYKKGFGGNWLTNLMNMQVTVTLSKNGQVQKEYTF